MASNGRSGDAAELRFGLASGDGISATSAKSASERILAELVSYFARKTASEPPCVALPRCAGRPPDLRAAASARISFRPRCSGASISETRNRLRKQQMGCKWCSRRIAAQSAHLGQGRAENRHLLWRSVARSRLCRRSRLPARSAQHRLAQIWQGLKFGRNMSELFGMRRHRDDSGAFGPPSNLELLPARRWHRLPSSRS